VGDVGRPGAAVAGDDGGDALGDVREVLARAAEGDRPVAVGVQVDEAGGDDQAGAVEDLRLPGDGELADGDHAVALEGDVADLSGPAGAVVDGAAAQDQVGLDGVGGGEEGEQCEGVHEGSALVGSAVRTGGGWSARRDPTGSARRDEKIAYRGPKSST